MSLQSKVLWREQLSPDEANDYAKIIQQKAQRFKNLTTDLFEVSKLQSGIDAFEMEVPNMCTFVRQVLAEKDSPNGNTDFDWKASIPDMPLCIQGDGKNLARALENLIQNCEKYAPRGTRIYVKVEAVEHVVITKIKNIANYEMKFDAIEITGRLVCGDAARVTEGSGLGLAIA